MLRVKPDERLNAKAIADRIVMIREGSDVSLPENRGEAPLSRTEENARTELRSLYVPKNPETIDQETSSSGSLGAQPNIENINAEGHDSQYVDKKDSITFGSQNVVENVAETGHQAAIHRSSPPQPKRQPLLSNAEHEPPSVARDEVGYDEAYENDYPNKTRRSFTHTHAKIDPLARIATETPGQQLRPRSPNSKKHKCPYCETEFTQHHNLKSHLLTHSQEKPYACDTCQMRLRRLHDLKRHSKLHTGENPHICPKCDRKFARRDALDRHSQGPGGCAGHRASISDDEDFQEKLSQLEGSMSGGVYDGGNDGDMAEEDRPRPTPENQVAKRKQLVGDKGKARSDEPETTSSSNQLPDWNDGSTDSGFFSNASEQARKSRIRPQPAPKVPGGYVS